MTTPWWQSVSHAEEQRIELNVAYECQRVRYGGLNEVYLFLDYKYPIQ